MAGVEEQKVEEAEYESDSEEDALFHWAMRRREASDDEDKDGEGEGDRERYRKVRIGRDDELDTLGGAPEYDDKVSYIDELEELAEEEEQEREEKGCEGEVSEERREKEVLAVPGVGRYYMHDDRLGGRRRGWWRRAHGGMDLWESKDELKWSHDKFQEMILRDKVRWIPKGRNLERTKDGDKSRGYINANRSRFHDSFIYQNEPLRIVRGRGPVRYRPFMKSNDVVPPTKYKRSGNPMESTSNISSVKVLSHASKINSDSLASKEHISASFSASASALFHHSTSSKLESEKQKRDVQRGKANRYLQASESNAFLASKELISASFSGSASALFHRSTSSKPESAKQKRDVQRGRTNRYLQASESNAFLQGKTGADIVDLDELFIQAPFQPVAENHLTKSSNEVNRVPLLAQHRVVQQRPIKSTVQSPIQLNIQQLSLRHRSGFEELSKSLSPNSFEPGKWHSLPRSGRSKVALVGKESGKVQASGTDYIRYGGTRQNFAATPALMPVMQLGNPHVGGHGGLGDPAVDMALKGYVGQSQVGFGNPGIKWIPVFTGAAETVGAACPCLTLGDGYLAHSLGPMSSVGVSSKAAGTNEPSNDNGPQIEVNI